MTPDLALTLSFEGISLLSRVPGGWHLLGEVALDDEDLSASLAALRAQAVEIAGENFETILVLPNEQIKYLDLPSGQMNEDQRRAQATEALEAATPYKADQLIFDLTIDETRPQVAAVARETLAEAEAFAMEHAFQPVLFTAIPPANQFSKAPDFGTTQAAGQTVSPDPQVIEVIGEGPLPSATASENTDKPELEDTAQEPEAQDIPAAASLLEVEAPAADTSVNEENAAQPSKSQPEPEAVPDTEPAVTQTIDEAVQTATEAPAAFASIRAQKASDTSAAPELSGVTRHTSGTNAPSIPAQAEMSDTPALRFDPAKAVAGLTAERSTDDPVENATDDRTQADAPGDTATFSSARSKTMVAGPAPRAAKKDPKPLGRRAQKQAAKESERQNLTLFGKRPTEVRGKPRYLGLILTAVLLAFLGGVALWASLVVEDGISGLFSSPSGSEQAQTPSTVTEVEVAEDPQVVISQTDDQSVAQSDVQDDGLVPLSPQPPELTATEELGGRAEDLTETVPAGIQDAPLVVSRPDGITPGEQPDLQTAILEPLATEDITDSAEIEMMLDEAADDVVVPADAEAHYAVTGIWQQAPTQPLELQTGTSDDIYIASVDRDTIGFDAVALPEVTDLATDVPPRAQVNPVAADTAFDLNERGLVVATPDGALTPEGILVFAGRPAVVPAAYPKRIIVGQETRSPEETSRLAALRPKLRPGDLVEQNERATLGGRTRAELGQVRPRLRPESQQQAERSDTAPTQYAVKTSLRPRPKPSNIAQLASRALPNETPQVEAVPTAAAITPDIPTTASVARQATIKNAINLRKTALIGVYGTSANRRALVRLSSGRYKKVQVGDRIDGGKVAAIDEDELRYVKAGRNVTLQMP
ncbi:hypothetical protein NBRC116594_06710 [Shimia sp. NS0008-38b]|uniref:hypothetical protein n=1 Tax=Shimia sp. NS0008-38b TaxID=3127653 RepID=UPI003104E4F7